MICGFTKAINKQKINIFSELLAEVIGNSKGQRGAEILLELFGGNLGSMSSGGHFFSVRSCQIPNPHRNFSPENKNIGALIFLVSRHFYRGGRGLTFSTHIPLSHAMLGA